MIEHVVHQVVGGVGHKDIMGEMLTTVSNFSKDAIAGGRKVVDSIEYGSRTLIVETTRTLGMVVVVKGKDTPEIRQRMRDVLWSIREHHKDEIIKAMDADVDEVHIAGLSRMLSRLFAK